MTAASGVELVAVAEKRLEDFPPSFSTRCKTLNMASADVYTPYLTVNMLPYEAGGLAGESSLPLDTSVRPIAAFHRRHIFTSDGRPFWRHSGVNNSVNNTPNVHFLVQVAKTQGSQEDKNGQKHWAIGRKSDDNDKKFGFIGDQRGYKLAPSSRKLAVLDLPSISYLDIINYLLLHPCVSI